MTFKDWLEDQFRLAGDISSKRLADLTGLSAPYISLLRSGRKDNPSVRVAERIAFAFSEARGLPSADIERLRAEATSIATDHSELVAVSEDPPVPLPAHLHGFERLYFMNKVSR